MRFAASQLGDDRACRFLDVLVASRLVESAKIDDVVNRYCRAYASGDRSLETLCEFLVRSEIVTNFQTEVLREGRYKGFFIDGYVIQLHVGTFRAFALYSAKERDSGREVWLAIQHAHITRVRGLVLYRAFDTDKEIPHEILEWRQYVEVKDTGTS